MAPPKWSHDLHASAATLRKKIRSDNRRPPAKRHFGPLSEAQLGRTLRRATCAAGNPIEDLQFHDVLVPVPFNDDDAHLRKVCCLLVEVTPNAFGPRRCHPMLAPTLCKPVALRAVTGLTEAQGEPDVMIRKDPMLEGSPRDLIARSHLAARPEREESEDPFDDAASQCDAIDAIEHHEQVAERTIEQRLLSSSLRYPEAALVSRAGTPLALLEVQHRLGHPEPPDQPTPSASSTARSPRSNSNKNGLAEDEKPKDLKPVPPIWPRRPALPRAQKFARALRELSLRTGRVPSPQEEKSLEVECEEIDLVGGNGAWQQRRAIAALERRLFEEEEIKRLAGERWARAQAKKAQREKQRQREEIERSLRWNETLENQAMSILDHESRAWEEAERKRLEEEEERRRLAALQPKVCDLCNGSGFCRECDGQGTVPTLLLAAKVQTGSAIVHNEEKKPSRSFGRVAWGCPTCCESAGVIPNDWVVGSGLCAQCDGAGKIFPSTPRRRRALQAPMAFGKNKSVKVVTE